MLLKSDQQYLCVAAILTTQVASAAVAAAALNQEFAAGGYARTLVKAGVFLPFMFGCIELVSGATGL
jgi:hypothetical protein